MAEALQLADELQDMTCLWSPSVNRARVDKAAAELRRLHAQREALLEALKMMTAHYCNLVNSGDAGNWDPDAEPKVLIARAAAKAVEETK